MNQTTEETSAPAVSVVVTSYNYAHLIRETLDAIAAQTFRGFEVLVVDNGSTDGSPDIIREYAARDPRFRLLQHEGAVNKGLPASVKLGVESARGEFVAFCEADDVWMPEHLERCMDLVAKSEGEANFLITDLQPFGDPDRCRDIEEGRAFRREALSGERNRITPEQFRRVNWIFTFSIVMVRRSVLLGCDFLSVPRPSNLDWWLWRQIALENDVWVVHERLTRWRLHKASFTIRDDNPESIAGGYDMAAKMDRMLVELHPDTTRDLLPFLRPEDDFRCEGGALVRKDGSPASAQPSFSVVLPENAPTEALAKTRASLDAQTYRNFETISDEEAAKNEWILPLVPGDALRDRALEVLAARIALKPRADAFFGTALCVGADRIVGGHTVVGGFLPCADGILRAFAPSGAFAVRRDGSSKPPTAPTELAFLARLCGADHPVFVDRILLLYDDGPAGRDPGAAALRSLSEEFSRARLPVVVRRRSLPEVARSAFSFVFGLLRRDGWRFFVKCARFAFSLRAWRWLFRKIVPGIPECSISENRHGGNAAKVRRFNVENSRRIGQFPSTAPRTIQEKLMWLNVFDVPWSKKYNMPLKSVCADKLQVKAYAKEKLGIDICSKTFCVYDHIGDIDWNGLPDQFVLKTNHNSGGTIICRDKSRLNILDSMEKLGKWLGEDFSFRNGFESHYHWIDRKAFAEELLQDVGQEESLVDYKFWCFNGSPGFFTIGAGGGHGPINHYDLHGNLLDLSRKDYPRDVNKKWAMPAGLDKMVEYSKALSEDFKFVRVDFYEVRGKVYLGEMTFTPGAFNFSFEDENDNFRIGQMLSI